MAKTTKTTKKTSNKTDGSSSAEGTLQYEKNGVKYYKVMASCACGAQFETGSTEPVLRVDICSNCHPFFTGEDRFVDAEGRVEKFKKKYNLS